MDESRLALQTGKFCSFTTIGSLFHARDDYCFFTGCGVAV